MRVNPWKLSTLVLAIALSLSLALPLISSADARGKRQPHMKAALTATKSALRQLKKAAPNKAGHRARAIGLLERAEIEIHKGIAAGRQ